MGLPHLVRVRARVRVRVRVRVRFRFRGRVRVRVRVRAARRTLDSQVRVTRQHLEGLVGAAARLSREHCFEGEVDGARAWEIQGRYEEGIGRYREILGDIEKYREI